MNTEEKEEILKSIYTNANCSYGKDIGILNIVKSIVLFAEIVTDSEACLVWFKGDDLIWSQSKSQNEKVLISSEDNLEICKSLETNQFLLYDKDTHKNKIEKLNSAVVKHIDLSSLESAIFTPILDDQNKIIAYISIFNKKNDVSKKFSVNDFQTLEIASLFASQTFSTINLSLLTNYYITEQNKAHEKQKTVIQNDFENKSNFKTDIFYKSSDILSGDIYSLYSTKNGDTLVFVGDAMGHGIAPSLTSFALATTVKGNITKSNNLKDLMLKVLETLQHILEDDEQLSCLFFWFDKEFKSVDYAIAGMYAPMIYDKGKDEVVSFRSNNIPFMNFSFDLIISNKKLEEFQSLIIYTDGVVEDTKDLDISVKKMLLDENYLTDSFNKLDKLELEDDTTIVKLTKIS